MELSDRKKRILKTIIDDYIDHAEPVGSKSVTAQWGGALSSATIRNEMSELEEMGLVEKPHTSAGRVPSQLGYRVYVDELMNSYQLTLKEVEELNNTLREKMSKLDLIASEAGKIVSRLTGHPTVTVSSHSDSISVRRFEFVSVDPFSYVLIIVTGAGMVKNQLVQLSEPIDTSSAVALSRLFNTFLCETPLDEAALEKLPLLEQMAGPAQALARHMADFLRQVIADFSDSEIFLEGAAKLLNYPEYRDPDKAKELLDFLSDRHRMRRIPLFSVENAISVAIGRENEPDELRDASVIYTTYRLPGGLLGTVAVIGPTRMDYAKTTAKLDAFVKGVSKLLPGNTSITDRDAPPGGSPSPDHNDNNVTE